MSIYEKVIIIGLAATIEICFLSSLHLLDGWAMTGIGLGMLIAYRFIDHYQKESK